MNKRDYGMNTQSIRVLLVDDDNDDYILTLGLLSEIASATYELEWISSFDEARDSLERKEYDVCLLDYRLGDRNGLELLSEVTKNGCSIPIILLTGQGDHEVDILSMKEGALDFLSKSQITTDSLERSIRYAIERRRMEIERAKLEAQALHTSRMESVGSLAAGIAHEINTPIQFVGDNTRFVAGAFNDLFKLLDAFQRASEESLTESDRAELLSHATIMEDKLDFKYLKQEIPKAIKQTLEGVERVANIVRAMKDFSHPTKDEKSLSDLNTALLSTLTVARNEIKYVAEVVTDLEESLPPVPCYLGDLNQVFLNLLVNAAHAIADADNQRSDKGTITVTTRRDGQDVVISISDTGKGIPEHLQDRIFDHFFTTKEVGRGTGQGLSISRSIVVDKHGGTLNFDTEEGKGTTFLIRLPISSKETKNVEEENSICR